MLTIETLVMHINANKAKLMEAEIINQFQVKHRQHDQRGHNQSLFNAQLSTLRLTIKYIATRTANIEEFCATKC